MVTAYLPIWNCHHCRIILLSGSEHIDQGRFQDFRLGGGILKDFLVGARQSPARGFRGMKHSGSSTILVILKDMTITSRACHALHQNCKFRLEKPGDRESKVKTFSDCL
ncbi:hypothetical protein DPMN_117307 [Dreissena polymorpha]|uniref:Uncharacterized protein n=1 Tax=Dreissena polymorpha TaxID=45954 RepID=A0A9D4KRG7_DREPO|nr:hypothetical protein DPMN_117307 [Dreissena polymorpha]